MKYPEKLHNTIANLPGVADVTLRIASLDGIDENVLSLPGEFADLPHMLLRRKHGQANEHMVGIELRFTQDMPGWVAMEFLAWWVRDISRSGAMVQMRALALPPVAFGTQLGSTLKVLIEFIFEIDGDDLEPIIKELDEHADFLETSIKQYSEAIENPTRMMTDDIDSIRECAENNDSNAQMQLAMMLMAGEGVDENKDDAFKWFERSAESGHPAALMYLGNCYLNGDGVSKDEKKAFGLYKQSAEQFPPSMGLVGHCYENGLGIKKDEKEAFNWYQKGAEAGEITCIAQMGECYEYGRGVKQDPKKAYSLYTEAYEYGFEAVEPAIERVSALLDD